MNCHDCQDLHAKTQEIRRLHAVCREYRNELEDKENTIVMQQNRISELEAQNAELERTIQGMEQTQVDLEDRV